MTLIEILIAAFENAVYSTTWNEICHDRYTLSSLIRFSVPLQTFRAVPNSVASANRICTEQKTNVKTEKKITAMKTKRKIGGSVCEAIRKQDSPMIAKSLDGSIVTRTHGGLRCPLFFSVSDASHCVVMCCHSYFIEKLISPFPKHAPISVCETQRLNNSS